MSYGKAPVAKTAQRAAPYGTAPKNNAPEEPRMIWVGNIPWKANWQMLKDHMKQVGTVEFCEVLSTVGEKGKPKSKGSAMVRFSTEAEAQNAIAMLNGSVILDRQINVGPWTGPKPHSAQGGKGGAIPPQALQQMIAQMSKAGGNWAVKGLTGFGRSKVSGDPAQMVYVGSVSFQATWQQLKDHMAQAGTVEFCELLTEGGIEGAKKKGTAVVRYSSAPEAIRAIATLNGSNFQGRNIIVDAWTKKSK